MSTHQERKETSRIARRQEDRELASDDQAELTPHRKKRSSSAAARRYGMEFKSRSGTSIWIGFNEWQRYYHWYETAAHRDAALTNLNRKEKYFEYRPIER